MSKGLTYDVK